MILRKETLEVKHLHSDNLLTDQKAQLITQEEVGLLPPREVQESDSVQEIEEVDQEKEAEREANTRSMLLASPVDFTEET